MASRGSIETAWDDPEEFVNKAQVSVGKDAFTVADATETAINNEIPSTETNSLAGTVSKDEMNSEDREQLNE